MFFFREPRSLFFNVASSLFFFFVGSFFCRFSFVLLRLTPAQTHKHNVSVTYFFRPLPRPLRSAIALTPAQQDRSVSRGGVGWGDAPMNLIFARLGSPDQPDGCVHIYQKRIPTNVCVCVCSQRTSTLPAQLPPRPGLPGCARLLRQAQEHGHVNSPDKSARAARPD